MNDIIITHKDGTKELLNSSARPSSVTKAEQKVSLLGADTVNIHVSTATPLNIEVGSTIEVYGRTYTLNLLPVIKRTGTRKFTYEFTFEGVQYELIDIQFLLPEHTIGDSFTGNLGDFLKLWIDNVKRVYGNKWALGEYPEDTEYLTLSFSGKNCLEVAQELCEEYGNEFEITQSNGIRTFHVRTAGANFPFTFRYGKTGGLYELTRKNINSKNVVTRLYVYGGSNNLGNSYRHSKLCLPGKSKNASYIESAEAIAAYGVKENTKNYDKIFPNRYGEVTAKGSTYYAFIDNTMNFDLNEKDSQGTKWLIDGVTGKIKMTTGNLAGYEFDIHKYTHGSKEIQVVPFTDENGFKFPSETSAAFQFGVGDKYIFTNINLPDQYKTDAEAELSKESNAEFALLCQPQVEYGLNIDQNFIKQFSGQLTVVNLFEVGDYIPVEDDDIGVNKAIRVTGYTRDLMQEYKYSLTLGDSVPTDITTRVISDLREIERVIDINQLADPAKAQRNWRASQEVLSMVFDPDGDYYSEKIKPGSIETMMLQSGARSMQFVLQNVIFQPNYEGNPNYVLVSAGKLVHYTIEENIRTWNIAQLSISNLVSGTAYYVYARCSLTEDDGSILLDTTQRRVDHEAGYYNFLVGVLNSVETDEDSGNPARSLSLMYGSSTINGRFIKTGRIESSGGGNTYFDLDNGEICGNIRFLSKDGKSKNVSDVEQAVEQAQKEADSKMRVFTDTPIPPYVKGDLWVNGEVLQKCKMPKGAEDEFSQDDWDPAVNYDNTITTINGDVVTSGTIQLAGDKRTILAGITGEGVADDAVRIWAGASTEDKESAPFSVLQDGSFTSTKANIEGIIKANSGEIGGFSVASGRIGAASSSGATSGQGLSLYNNFIKFADSSRWASIGTNVLPPSTGHVAVGRFTNTTNTSLTNYGLVIDVKNAGVNLAIDATGDIISNGAITDYGFTVINPTTNQLLILGSSINPTLFKIIVRFNYSNSGIGLPTRSSVASKLGISSSTTFAVKMTIICSADSTINGYIRGRNSDISGMNTTQYPQRLNNDSVVETGKLAMGAGDVDEFMLVWDNVSYRAYHLNHRN